MLADGDQLEIVVAVGGGLILKDPLVIAGKSYGSRLLVGTGKYRDFAETRAAVDASGAQIVTVAIRRTNIGQNAQRAEPARCAAAIEVHLPAQHRRLLHRGRRGAHAAPRARAARRPRPGEARGAGRPAHALPQHARDAEGRAATLVKDGFKVMVYCSDDPIQAQMLEAAGCVAVMPLASLIGSGMGILNPWNLQLVIEKVKVPVIVDAGVGTASDAAIAMELGCDGVLMNTAIAAARDPVLMAHGDAEGGRSRARGLPRRPHAEEALLGDA